MWKATDLTGQVFGRLRPIRRVANSATGRARWLCRCVCGKRVEKDARHLRSGATQSCGCLARQRTGESSRTHGMTGTPTYTAWSRMKAVCYRPSHPGYARYGGRGITVCDRWRDSFENFLADMGVRPAGMSLDRLDNDGPYSPENCAWSTNHEQANNKRNNRWLTFDRLTLTVAQWSSRTGISDKVLYNRVRAGWSVSDTLRTPVGAPRASQTGNENAKRNNDDADS